MFGPGFRAELLSLLQWRRDVRRFRADAIDDATFRGLLDTACLAPSVGLSQPWRFVTVDDPGRRAAIRANFARCNQAALAAQAGERAALYARLKLEGLERAPRHLAVFAERDPAAGHALGRATMPEMVAYSAVIAVHTIWLAARATGIGVGWVSILDPAEVSATLEVDPAWTFVAYLCLGYPEAESDLPELERAGWERRRPPHETVLLRR